MDVRSCLCIDIKKGERTYYFYMPIGAPFGEAYDAAFEALTSITEMAKQAVEKARPQETKESNGTEKVDSAKVVEAAQ